MRGATPDDAARGPDQLRPTPESGQLALDVIALGRMPEPDVRVQYKYHGAATSMVVLVTVALLPFVHAIASTFGRRLAEALDDAARRALRRLVARFYDRPELADKPDHINWEQVRVVLTHESTGITVVLDQQLPPKAIAQLVRMDFDSPTVANRTIVWWQTGSPAGAWYTLDGWRHHSAWDDHARQWRPIDQPTSAAVSQRPSSRTPPPT